MKFPTHHLPIFISLFLAITTQAADFSLSDSLYHSDKIHVVKKADSDIRHFHTLSAQETIQHSDPIIAPQIIEDDSTIHHRNKALQYQQEVMEKQSFARDLNTLSGLELPVGIMPQNGDPNYAIIVSKFESVPGRGSFLEVYLVLELPQTGDKIAFRGKDIFISNTGGFSGTGRLELIGQYPIAINDKTLFTIMGATKPNAPSNTYASFDCNGFSGMGIEAEVEFSRDWLIPEDDKGNPKPAPERVKTRFSTHAQSWNDLMVGITLPPFQVASLKGFSFSVQEAFLDWSDLANPPGLNFPAGYTSPFIAAGTPTLWRGIYMQRLTINLPKSFKKKGDTTQRTSIGVQHMLLDDQGFSGIAFAEGPIIQAGDMSGWSYSLSKVALELVTNQVTGFELGGKLTIPIVKDDKGNPTEFAYQATRAADGNYQFAITVQSNLTMPLLMAQLNLHQGSSITITEKNNTFYPTALLNGSLGIRATGKGPKAELAGITFEGMRISTEEPRFDIQAVSFGREGMVHNISKFPVSITHIGVKKEANQRLGLGFDLSINIGGSAPEEGFSGTAGLIVWGKREEQPIKDAEGQVIGTEQNHWRYDNIELTAIGIDIRKPGVFQLAGSVRFFEEDPTYGEGFGGTLRGSFGKVGEGVAFDLRGLFGKTPEYRYWYVDALVKIDNGFAIIPGVLHGYGIGGGYYHKMKQSTQPIAGTLGKNPSGITYIPDQNTRGIRAVMLIGGARKEAWNGDVGLEVVLNNHGGINSTTLSGTAKFMDAAQMGEAQLKELAGINTEGKLAGKLSSMINSQVYAAMRLHFDNVNDVFHGNMEVYVNVAAGIVRGVSAGNKAGWAVLHFEPNDWYVHIGTPDQPLGLEVARIFKSKSYIMMGKNLPGSPAPPSQVSEILGGRDFDYMRDMNALQSGTGFAFGMHFIVDTGNLKFLMFYGRFSAGAGFDFMLKDYGTSYHCAGSSGPMGINGWFANGQVYAFVMGKIGIRVNLKFYKGNYDILSIGAAAILQGKGPNPFWMKGTVGGYYRILGGLVKGNCKFDVTVGQDCVPVGEQNLLGDVNMIAEMTPAKGTTEVDVFNTPQVAFNIPVGEVFEITDLENKIHRFRAVLDEFNVLDNGQPLIGELQWNAEKDVVVFDGRDILPGQKQLTANARLSFEEHKNGQWVKVTFQGSVVEETASTRFETGEAPDYIPANNVAVSYPLAGQAHFLPNEYNQGFIQLKDGQPYLFAPGSEWTQTVRMTAAGTGRYAESSLSYNAAQKRVHFSIPQGLSNGSIYAFEILNIPRQTTVPDANISDVETRLSRAEDAAGEQVLTTKEAEGDVSRLEVKVVYGSEFGTSRYNTFAQKMAVIQIRQTMRIDIDVNLFQLASYIDGPELLDAAELSGLMGANKLIQFEAILTDNDWYQNHVYPLVYEGYPLLGRFSLRHRTDPQRLGIPPARDVYFHRYEPELAVEDKALNPAPATSFSRQNIRYNVMIPMAVDFNDIQLQVVNFVASNPTLSTPRLNSIITKRLPIIRYGPYRFRMDYVIPGTNTVSSSYTWELFNAIRD